MTKLSPLTNVLFPVVAILFCAISQCLAALSDKRLCFDPNCSEAISLAKTVLAYVPNDHELMSFGINVDVKVFSKGAGKRTDLWGVEINGERGYAPKSFLKEYKVLQRVLSHEVPVYKFTDEVHKVQTKELEPTEKAHKVHPLLKDKLLSRDKEAPSSSEKSTGESIREENGKTEKLESTENLREAHPSSRENLPRDDNESAKSVDEIERDSKAIDADDTSPSYEVIDGTTLHFESKPSIQPSFVIDAVRVTALPSEQAPVSYSDSRTNFGNGGDTFTSDIEDKHEGIKLLVDTSKETDGKVLLENSEAIINSNVDTASETDTLLFNGSSEPSENEPSKNSKREEGSANSGAESRVDPDEEEEVTESVENEGIFASIARKFITLSSDSFGNAAATENIAGRSSSDTPASEATVESDTQLREETSDNAGVKDVVTEEDTRTELEDSSAAPSFASGRDAAAQRETVRENTESAKVSDEMKVGEETAEILAGSVTSTSDVPSSSNFVLEDAADKSAKDTLMVSSVLASDSSASVVADISSPVESVETAVQEPSKAEKVAEAIGNEGVTVSLGSTVSSDAQESATARSVTMAARGGSDSEENLPEDEAVSAEIVKEDSRREEVAARVDRVAATDKISETGPLSSVDGGTPAERGNIKSGTFPENRVVGESADATDEASSNRSAADIRFNEELIVHSSVNRNDNLGNDASSDNDVPIESNEFSNDVKSGALDSEQSVDSSQKSTISGRTSIVPELPSDRYLLHVEDPQRKNVDGQIGASVRDEDEASPEYDHPASGGDEISYKDEDIEAGSDQTKESKSILDEMGVTSDKVCLLDQECTTESAATASEFLKQKTDSESEEHHAIDTTKFDYSYWKTLIYLSVTAFTTLAFTLGYYYIENIRRDGQLIARINKLEKELLIAKKECDALSENLESTKEELSYTRDEYCTNQPDFNEMVVTLKADLDASLSAKVELEDQVTMLEKDLENATEAGLELERMLREVLSSNNEVNPLAQSVEDLQTRLDAQQAANESLTNALSIKAQELEALSVDLSSAKKKCEEFEVKLLRVQNELATQKNLKNNIEQMLKEKIYCLEVQVKELSTEKSSLYNELRGKEIEVKDLVEVVNQVNSNSLDLEKFYDVSRVKTEAVQLREERDELKMRLSDVEGAHQLLEEHMKLIKEEVAALSDQCKIAEKEKKEAETRLEVLSKFFKEKEAERQKEEAIWLQQQGEVISTVERLHTMQNEIQNYKQQVEMLKREIVDQEREYKYQISALETKAHEQWVTARQNERRLEESKAEASQLRNRLTLVEKNLNDSDSETKLHRLEANGETATSLPLFIGAESSGSPVMFSGASGVPPPPPSYLHFPPYLPPLPPTASGLPPYDISQRPPPLGGRLSSPPPMPPPPPPLHPPATCGSRSPPPPFGGDHIPPPPPPGSILPPPIGTAHHPWGEESLPPLRNSGFHPHQREQRARNHKGSLHSSGESLDKAHHGKV